MIISKTFTFEASHVLPFHPGKCSNLHGHSWKLVVAIEGLIDPATGFVADYAELKRAVNQLIISKVDHQHLGCGNLATCYNGPDILATQFDAVFGPDFYPSSENLITRFAEILQPVIPTLNGTLSSYRPRLHSLSLNETCTSECVWSADSKS